MDAQFWHQPCDPFNQANSLKGDESSTTKIGYMIFGQNEQNMGDMNRMPREATGAEVLDINNLLSAVSNYKEFALGEGFLSIDMYDAKEEVFQFAKSKFLERILNAADNLTDATQAAVDATGGGSPKAIPDDMNAVKIELGKDRKTITKMLPSKSGSHNDTLDWLSGRADRSRPDTHYRQPIIKKP